MAEPYGGMSVAEGGRPKKAAKVLHHLEVHPKMGGGVRVEHHYSSPHNMEPHEFEEHEGGKFHAHMTKHTGLSHEKIEEQGDSEPEPFE